MAVKMRLMRMGKTKSPHYRVVVMDGRAPRDGRYIEQIGRYDPRQDPSVIEIDADRAVDWLEKGAQPTETVRKLLEVSGALTQFKVTAGKIHTVGGDIPASEEPEATEAPAEPETAEEAETATDEAPAEAETTETAEAATESKEAPTDSAETEAEEATVASEEE